MSLVDLSMLPFQRAYLMIFGKYPSMCTKADCSHVCLDIRWEYCFCELLNRMEFTDIIQPILYVRSSSQPYTLT